LFPASHGVPYQRSRSSIFCLALPPPHFRSNPTVHVRSFSNLSRIQSVLAPPVFSPEFTFPWLTRPFLVQPECRRRFCLKCVRASSSSLPSAPLGLLFELGHLSCGTRNQIFLPNPGQGNSSIPSSFRLTSPPTSFFLLFFSSFSPLVFSFEWNCCQPILTRPGLSCDSRFSVKGS